MAHLTIHITQNCDSYVIHDAMLPFNTAVLLVHHHLIITDWAFDLYSFVYTVYSNQISKHTMLSIPSCPKLRREWMKTSRNIDWSSNFMYSILIVFISIRFPPLKATFPVLRREYCLSAHCRFQTSSSCCLTALLVSWFWNMAYWWFREEWVRGADKAHQCFPSRSVWVHFQFKQQGYEKWPL